MKQVEVGGGRGGWLRRRGGVVGSQGEERAEIGRQREGHGEGGGGVVLQGDGGADGGDARGDYGRQEERGRGRGCGRQRYDGQG